MNIVYIHGLDSNANSVKGLLLERYCKQNHPEINVLRPDLNKSPEQVFVQLKHLVARLQSGSCQGSTDSMSNTSSKTVLVGSSLGGYFSTLISNHTGCPALLLNPSTQPHVTLQRFSNSLVVAEEALNNQILHTTAGGWVISREDLNWFSEHQLQSVLYPEKVAVLIKEGDELLDPNLSARFYQQQEVVVTMQLGGDHRFSDFEQQLPMVIEILKQL